jgi:hypothetical protein
VFQMHVSSVSSAFRRMLQVCASGYFRSRSGVASPSLLFCCLATVSPPPLGADWASAALPLLDVGDVWGGTGPCGRVKRHGKQTAVAGSRRSVYLDSRALASKPD